MEGYMAIASENISIKVTCKVIGGGNKITRKILAFVARALGIKLDADAKVVI
jgi:hypothetical protein